MTYTTHDMVAQDMPILNAHTHNMNQWDDV